MKKIIGSLILLIFVLSCNSTKSVATTDEDINTIYLFQNGIEKKLLNFEKAIEIKRKPFSLRFFNKAYDGKNKKFHSVQIAALLDKKELNEIRVGMKIDDATCFSPGSGLSADKDGYKTLYFGNFGHHYLFYENEQSKRLNLLKKRGEFLKLEFNINSFTLDGKKYSINDFELDSFYLALLNDVNLNGIIEINELTKITFILSN